VCWSWRSNFSDRSRRAAFFSAVVCFSGFGSLIARLCWCCCLTLYNRNSNKKHLCASSLLCTLFLCERKDFIFLVITCFTPTYVPHYHVHSSASSRRFFIFLHAVVVFCYCFHFFYTRIFASKKVTNFSSATSHLGIFLNFFLVFFS
jgi:hypothetical protein